jgi:hypothetical protein
LEKALTLVLFFFALQRPTLTEESPQLPSALPLRNEMQEHHFVLEGVYIHLNK